MHCTTTTIPRPPGGHHVRLNWQAQKGHTQGREEQFVVAVHSVLACSRLHLQRSCCATALRLGAEPQQHRHQHLRRQQTRTLVRMGVGGGSHPCLAQHAGARCRLFAAPSPATSAGRRRGTAGWWCPRHPTTRSPPQGTPRWGPGAGRGGAQSGRGRGAPPWQPRLWSKGTHRRQPRRPQRCRGPSCRGRRPAGQGGQGDRPAARPGHAPAPAAHNPLGSCMQGCGRRTCCSRMPAPTYRAEDSVEDRWPARPPSTACACTEVSGQRAAGRWAPMQAGRQAGGGSAALTSACGRAARCVVAPRLPVGIGRRGWRTVPRCLSSRGPAAPAGGRDGLAGGGCERPAGGQAAAQCCVSCTLTGTHADRDVAVHVLPAHARHESVGQAQAVRQRQQHAPAVAGGGGAAQGRDVESLAWRADGVDNLGEGCVRGWRQGTGEGERAWRVVSGECGSPRAQVSPQQVRALLSGCAGIAAALPMIHPLNWR